MNDMLATLSPEDRALLMHARARLEHPSFAARLSSVVGTPIETGLKLLPRRWYRRLHDAAEAGVARALDAAIDNLGDHPPGPRRRGYYRLMGAGSGAVGGTFGLPGLVLELPVSTTLMLQAIAEQARAHGEPLDRLETRMACMEVFALGGRAASDDAAETGYYGLRLALGMSVTAAMHHIATRGVSREGAPALVNLIVAVSSRFGAVVSQRAAAQLVPVVGAAGAACVNLLFMQHFLEMADSHFAVRRLERTYGAEVVQAAYAAAG
jgi:hypothetical protein